uniref:Phytocyanin domain-containing protein n=1 Tax=Oryza brachyantha TaxID=4533 RepID=J3L9U1_ORYBR
MASRSCVVAGAWCFVLLHAVAMGAAATQYKVGGDGGWGVPGAGAESYNTWAEKTSFQIGDQLLFVYPKDKDSVLLVEPADYNACNTASYDKKFADGSTTVTLDRAGAFFFISGVDANCRANEKLIVMYINSQRLHSDRWNKLIKQSNHIIRNHEATRLSKDEIFHGNNMADNTSTASFLSYLPFCGCCQWELGSHPLHKNHTYNYHNA